MSVEAIDLELPVNNMVKPKNQLFCRLDGLTPGVRKEQRLTTLNELGLMVAEAVPILEETTQKAASFTNTPISILGLAVEEEIWFKSALGLSAKDLTNQLATQRKIALQESFSTYVIDSQQPLAITNTFDHATFVSSILAQHYGIKAYLGVPLITTGGICIGTLEVMDWVAREFDDRDIDHLALLARWCLSEFERNRLLKMPSTQVHLQHDQPLWQTVNADALKSTYPLAGSERSPIENLESTRISAIKLKLLCQLTQELKTPLTSVIGMASVLHREVYGSLTVKQKEYLEIIHDSGQNLISLVDEIVSLGILSDRNAELNPTTVDLEMLCQQVINSLEELAKQDQQKLSFAIEPGNRLSILDKDKIRQALYYLLVSIIEMSEPGGEITIHASQRNQGLNIAVGISHPWLGNDFNETKLRDHGVTQALRIAQNSYRDRPMNQSELMPISSSIVAHDQSQHLNESRSLEPSPSPRLFRMNSGEQLTSSALMMVINEDNNLEQNTQKIPRDLLGLLFCCHLTEMQGGKVIIQGSPSSGYRYLLQIPALK